MRVVPATAFRAGPARPPALARRELDDLSTRGDRDRALPPDALHIAPPRDLWTPLPSPVPGRLVEGALPPDHFARFLLRLPRDWNGGLIAAAASGITDERTYDIYLSDFALSRGFAFAATDKGTRRAVLDGDTVLVPHHPEASVRLWLSRLEALIALAREEARDFYGRPPDRVLAAGLSNGGFVARRAAEVGLCDAAAEASGVFWSAERGGLLRDLPAALRGGPRAGGFPAPEGRWGPVADWYRDAYWEASLRLFIGDLDPGYGGDLRDYDPAARPGVLEALRALENTGDLKAPLVSLAGRRDYLISCAGHAEAYRDLVASRGKAALHRLVVVEDAAHMDSHKGMFPFLEPLMPRLHAALLELDAELRSPAAAATAPSSLRRG